MTRIKIELNDGSISYSGYFRSETERVALKGASSTFELTTSSESIAQSVINESFRRGFFKTSDGVCIPTSRVKQASLE